MSYIKSLFREYTNSNFDERLVRPEWAHLGLLGPAIRAIIGDTIKIYFKNDCSSPASMHPHGVKYDKSLLSVTLGGMPLDLKPNSISLLHKFDTVSFDRKIRKVFELKVFSKNYQYLSMANKIFNNKIVLYQAPFEMKINKTLLIFYIRYEILHEVIKSVFKKNFLKYYLFLDRCYKSLFSMFR